MKASSLVCMTAFLSIFVSQASFAELAFSVYGGKSSSPNADIHVSEPNGTDITLKSVPLEDESFKPPVYYGARLAYWFERGGSWGLAADFAHLKIHANPSDEVEVSGSRAGDPVGGRDQIRNTLRNFSVSDGLNFLTMNLFRRWEIIGGVRPYLGAGLGITLPHVEAQTALGTTSAFQRDFPAAQAMAGLELNFIGPVAFFGEYKFSYADLNLKLASGGEIELKTRVQQIALGLGVHL